jgi:hypothetical protein
MIQKEKYLAPQIEIIKMENEGIIATSGNLPSVGNGGSAYSSRARSTRGYNGAISSDLEDMINDILTIEQ